MHKLTEEEGYMMHEYYVKNVPKLKIAMNGYLRIGAGILPHSCGR